MAAVDLKLARAGRSQSGNSADVKEWKERETRRWNAIINEQRTKFEREKQEALSLQRDAMNRAFRAQLCRLAAEREELTKKVKLLEQQQHRVESSSSTAKAGASSELHKLACENAVLRSEKKKLEDTIHGLRESEQKRRADLRHAADQKNSEVSQLQRQTRQEITRLLEECKTKDRVISQMESEVRAQCARAEQFRDLLERSLLPKGLPHPQASSHEDVNGRERKLQLQVADLQEKMRQQHDNFTQEKLQLVRRVKEVEEQQQPLREKSKRYLIRNVELACLNRQLQQSVKEMQHQVTRERTNLKRSLTRPNLTSSLDCDVKNDKQRRAEYVKQIQKLRKEQRYYSMWELPPLLEVETDSSGAEASESSMGSLSPNSSSGDWWRGELEMMLSQLSREHAELQRSYQVMHSRLAQLLVGSETDADTLSYSKLQADCRAARARISELEELLQLQQSKEQQPRCKIPSLLEVQAKFVREKLALQARLNAATRRAEETQARCIQLQAEANELRDQNELLEFRILELEDCQEKGSSRCSTPRGRKDVCTDTDSDDVSVGDSGVVSLTSLTCASPPSPSPLASDGDFLNEKLQALKGPLSSVISSLSSTSHKSTMLQLQALLEVCHSRAKQTESTTIDKVNNWELHLQESGIFDEESAVDCDVSVQTDSKSFVDAQSQAELQCRSVAVQVLGRATEDKAVQLDHLLEAVGRQDATVQTLEQLIPVDDLRELEKYYEEQIDILQRERHDLRRALQEERNAAEKQVTYAEDLEERHLRLQQLLEEREQQLDICRQRYDEEVESWRKSTRGDVAILKECLQMIWHEIKDVTYVPETCETSLLDFTQNVLSGVQFICCQLPKLQIKVAHLSQLEHAFQTTIQQADGLVRDIELQHLERIRVLERSEQDLKKQLEFFLAQIPHAASANNTDSSHDSMEGKMQEVEEEKEALSLRWRDMQDHCQRLQNRVEELEMVETALRQSIVEAERRFSLREQRLKEELIQLQGELDRYQESESKLEHRMEKKRVELVQLKEQLDEKEQTVESLKNDIRELESRLEKEDSSFKNELTKLRAHLNLSLSQLNELELLNCQLREQLCEYKSKICDLEKHIVDEASQNEKLREENSRLQADLHNQAHAKVKSLTDELREVNFTAEATLEDFEEISLSATPTGLENNDTFDEHVRILESLENFLDGQEEEEHLLQRPETQLQWQLAELQLENESLRTNLQTTESQKNNVIRILLDQLRSKDESSFEAAQAAVEAAAVQAAEEQKTKMTTMETTEAAKPVEQKKQMKKELQLPNEDPLLSVPGDFQVTRTVGKDGVVVAWTPPKDDSVTGYLICVNNEESQRIRSAQRTKAVLCGLDLQQVLDICIYSLSMEGLISPPVHTKYNGKGLQRPTETAEPSEPVVAPREVVVQTFYTNSSVTVRSSRVASTIGSRIPVRSCVP